MVPVLATQLGHGAAWWALLQHKSETARLLGLQLIATYRSVCPSFHIGEGERGGASCGCGLLVDSRVLTPCALCVHTAQATQR